MPIERVAIDASPLIVLFKSNQAQLLPQMCKEIVVPQMVFQEVLAGGMQDAAAQQLPTSAWVTLVEVTVHPSIAAWDLGAGETAVLSFALANPGYRAMVDDRAARRCARSLGIATLGTGGAIVLAKKRGLISSVANSLQLLQDSGLWLGPELVELLKTQAGE